LGRAAWVDDPANWRPRPERSDGDAIVMFGDGSKSDDATGLLAVRISDGFMQTLHFQHPTKGEIVSRLRWTLLWMRRSRVSGDRVLVRPVAREVGRRGRG
jgi:hypothetical protein